MKDLLKRYDELWSNVGLGGSEDGNEARANGSLLLIRDGRGGRLLVFGLRPALVYAVLEVYCGYRSVSMVSTCLLLPSSAMASGM